MIAQFWEPSLCIAAGFYRVRGFEEIGTLTREQWNARFGPFDERGAPVPTEELPVAIALREGRPAYGRFHVGTDRGMIEVEAGALPLVGAAGYHGAMVVFWVPDEQEN